MQVFAFLIFGLALWPRRETAKPNPRPRIEFPEFPEFVDLVVSEFSDFLEFLEVEMLEFLAFPETRGITG